MSRLNNNPDLGNVKKPIIKEIMSFHRMTEEEAEGFIQYNTIRSLPYYENHPVVIRGLDYLS